MRKALVVGIDKYQFISGLHGCVNDASQIVRVLSRHEDNSVNFSVKSILSKDDSSLVDRETLRNLVQELFLGDSEISLFYFAGHGHIESTGGYLVASDSRTGNDGLALSDIVTFANNSPAKNRVIVLDSCHSGIAASGIGQVRFAELKEGTTILTASTAEQYASEVNGSGVFTTLLVDALDGAASNLVGEITPGSVYAHIDQSLGPWDQRPVFKTNVKSFVSLRKVRPPVLLSDLHRLVDLFPTANASFALDPTYEPERGDNSMGLPPPIPENTEKFALLQKFNRVNLVVPVDAPHMWHAAVNSKSCKLTTLGRHYWSLVSRARI